MNDFLTIYTHENKEDNLKFCFFSLKKTTKDGKEINTQKEALYF